MLSVWKKQALLTGYPKLVETIDFNLLASLPFFMTL